MSNISIPDSKRLQGNLNIDQQHGVVAVIVALSMVVLVGFVGLALDLGKLFVTKTELQNSADACALAAARELTGANTNQLTLAEAAGIAAGTSNHVQFQSSPVTVNAGDVTFSDTLNGTYLTKDAVANALTMRFARCTVQRSDIANWFVQVLGIGNQQVNATAVASLVPGQTTCAIPVGVCSTEVPPSTPVGTWLQSVIGPPKGSDKDKVDLTGNFMWVDFTPPGGGSSELAEQLTGSGVCDLPALGSEVGEAGVKSSLADDWNSRFGIYKGNVKAQPDYSGYAYTDINWLALHPSGNAFPDFQNKRGSNEPYQGDASTGLNIKGDIQGSPYLHTHGIDRRLATVAVVDCDGLTKGTTSPVTEWACVLMLHPINNSQGNSNTGTGTGADRMYLEYLGRSNQANSPCASSGMVGGPGSIGPLVPALVQ